MAESSQSYAHHTRWDPWFHFFVIPVFVLVLLLTLVHFFAHLSEGDFRDHFHALLMIVLAIALLLAVFKIRTYALKVQDRVIRLEERLRLMALMPEPMKGRIAELREGQLVALRFASDGEVAKLAERAMNEKLSGKEIKKAIQQWRPDDWRV